MNMILRKITTAVRILPKLVENNVRRKRSFAVWHSSRKQISNWFYLYLYYSSFLLDLLSIEFGKSEWMRRLTIKAVHTHGPSFRFPLIAARDDVLLAWGEENPPF